MNRKQIILSVLTFDFLALTGYAIYQHGYLGIFERVAESSATILLAVDLLLALGMVVGWMWVDANRHGLRVWPYLLLSALLGSAGPMLYLIRRESLLARKP
jgi:hypothetical protein